MADSGKEPTPTTDESPAPRPSSLSTLRVWFTLGVQSFGGGTATLALIRRAVVEQYGWISEAEFTRIWALVQVAPGINLLALTILIGRRTGGARGIGIAMLGLLLPSVTITTLLAAGYAHIEKLPAVQAALKGIIPATVGIGLLTGLNMARPPLIAAKREGAGSLTLSLLLMAGSGLAVAAGHWQVILVLLLAGGIAGFAAWLRSRRSSSPGGTGAA